MEDLQEERQGKLIEVVDLVQVVDREIDGTAGRSQWHVLLAGGFNFSHDRFGLLGFLRDLGGLALQSLEGGNDCVVIQDSAFSLVQNLSKSVTCDNVIEFKQNTNFQLALESSGSKKHFPNLKKILLKMSESKLEFSLEFKEVRSLLIDVRSLGLQNLLKKTMCRNCYVPQMNVMYCRCK